MPELLKFDHYELLTRGDGSPFELGRGAMGITYKAFDSNLRIPVALKVINVPGGGGEGAQRRFVQEARAAAQLRHRHVASVFHLGEEAGGVFYAMEFIDGETVEALRQRCGPLPELVALRLTQQVARALQAAEQHGLVHRDIKPSNLMLVWEDDELCAKVIDFGLAQVPRGEEEGAALGAGFVGTPLYASPEQLGEHAVDVRSDLYSLGATLWFMLTGEPPFTGTVAEVTRQHLTAELPVEKLRGVSPGVVELLRRLLAKDPAARFQKAVEVRQAIEQCHEAIAGGPAAAAARLALESARLVRPPPASRETGAYHAGLKIADRYEIREALGATGHGWLYRAFDVATSRPLRLLLLALDLRQEAATFTQWEQAVLALERLEHPNLLRTYGLETVGEHAVVLQEWTEGPTLLQVLRTRRKLETAETLRLLPGLAEGVDYAQEHGVGPLDLSLHRVHLHFAEGLTDGAALLETPVTAWPPFVLKIDPLALSRELAQSMTWAGGQTLLHPAGAVETPAPVADPGVVQTRALALLIYELLGGSVTPLVAAKASLQGLPRYSPLANLTEEGNDVLRRALGAERPFTRAAELGQALAQVGELELPLAPPPTGATVAAAPSATRVPLAPPPTARRSWIPLGTALVLLVAATGAYFWPRTLSSPKPEPLPMATPLPQAEPTAPVESATAPAAPSSPTPDRRALLQQATAHAEEVETQAVPAETLAAWLEVARDFPESEIGRMRLEIEVDALRPRGPKLTEAELAELNPPLREAAELGVVSAMMMLGELQRAQQPEEAFSWLAAAAAKGVPAAATQVGLMYSNGTGVERNYVLAAEYFQMAAAKGDDAAKLALGECYLLGKGVEKDSVRALALLQESAAHSNSRALNRLGLCYQHGDGVTADFAEAQKLFTKAAALGSTEALGNLGIMAVNGEGLPKPQPRKALQYFQRGAEAGNGYCMYQLARCFESGTGVEQKNPVLAQQWYQKAAAKGLQKAIEWCQQNGVPPQP